MALLSVIRIAFRGSSGLTKAALNLQPLDEETVRDRRQTCAHCGQASRTRATHIQSLRVLSPTSTCGVCKCVIHAKTKLAEERCPLGLW